MNRPRIVLLRLAVACFAISMLSSCSKSNIPAPSASNTSANAPAQQSPVPAQSSASQQKQTEPGAIAVGEASGNYTAKGETVQLKYAYAGRGIRFSKESVIVLVTDKPIPPESLAEELKSQTMFYDQKIRGLEYVFETEGYWVRYHPSQYQESKIGHSKNIHLRMTSFEVATMTMEI